MKKVLCVLTTSKFHARDLPAIVKSLRKQSVPTKIVLVGNSAQMAGVPPAALAELDNVFRLHYLDAPDVSRFLPALSEPDCFYTYFQPDDCRPGPLHLESLLSCAQEVSNEFAVIGQDGRRIEGGQVATAPLPLADKPQRVDLCVGSMLVRTDLLPHVINFRNQLRAMFPKKTQPESDMLLSLGIQYFTSFSSFVTAAEPRISEQQWLFQREQKPTIIGYTMLQSQCVAMASEFGWKSLV